MFTTSYASDCDWTVVMKEEIAAGLRASKRLAVLIIFVFVAVD